MVRRTGLLVFVALYAAGSAAAAPGVLDLVPQDAAAALAVRNLGELKKKGDKFAADAELQSLPRVSQLFDMLLDGLGIRAGVDLDSSMAFVVANPDLLGVNLFDKDGKLNWQQDFVNLFVLAIPVRDGDALAADLGIAKGALKPDSIVEGKGKSFGEHFCLHGKHLYFGNSAKVVKSVATSVRAGTDLTAGQRRALDRADLLLHLHRKHIAPLWKEILKDLQKNLAARTHGEDDAKAVHKLIETLGVIDTSWLAVRLDEGLGISWVNTIPKEGAEEARQFLASLRRGPGTADLAGLPEGRVVAAEALRGDGEHNAAIARVFFAALWEHAFRGMGWVSPADRASHVGVFTEIWKHLKGSRAAVYQNADRASHGLLSAVAILDTADAEKFLAELRQLARFGGDDLDLSEKTGQRHDVVAVEKLVRDLGDDHYPVREAASTKLTLIGEPALPLLEKALKSDDAEVRRRAADIKETIVTAAVERRKEALDKEALRHVRPTFGFAARAESLEGTRVDVLRVRLAEKDAKAAASLKELFGPEWDRIRLVIHGQQVVVLIGSDRELLKAALTNLKEGKRGLADGKVLAGAANHANLQRRAEVHLSLAAMQMLWAGADLEKPGAAGRLALTSFAVTIDLEFLELDVWIPPSEAKVIERAGTP
jgi:hypothetical protein